MAFADEGGASPVAIDVPASGFADQLAQRIARAEPRFFTNLNHGSTLRSLVRPAGFAVHVSLLTSARAGALLHARKRGRHVHYRFSTRVGTDMGLRIGDYVVKRAMQPIATSPR
jgi:hypothetical protein